MYRKEGCDFYTTKAPTGPDVWGGGEETGEGRAEHESVQIPTHPQPIRAQPYKPKPHHHHRFLLRPKKTGKDKGGPEPKCEQGGEVEFDSGWWWLLLLLLWGAI